jgi:hypothetical protein
MAATITTTLHIMDVLARSDSDGCLLEDLIRQCTDLTWNQVFFELDRLSLRGAGRYVATAVSREGAVA